jgi:hypothetical protein
MKLPWLAALFASAVVAAAARADGGYFRCGNSLVSKGDRPARVLALCGQPSDVSRASTWRTPVLWYAGGRAYYGAGLVETPVEVWTYNTGPNDFMRELRFEAGTLVAVRTLGYGYR